jgi:coenzyme F420 hydrogenase subunit beta
MNTPVDQDIFDSVVRGGYCIGCGACAVIDDHVSIELTALGTYQAIRRDEPSGEEAAALAAVCPFSAGALDETTLARRLFATTPDAAAPGPVRWHDEVGFHRAAWVGHVAEGDFRARGSSGGMASWLALELLRRGEIDGVIHVQPCLQDAGDKSLLFKMAISRTPEELLRGARSRYYPVTMAEVLREARSMPTARLGLVGVPCFVKAARLLALRDPVLAGVLRFHIGLICGHLKSATYAEYLGWLAGVLPHDLGQVEFRRKTDEHPANHYLFSATSRSSGNELTVLSTDVPAGDWGLGCFKYKACDYCDDVMAETADVVIGDAWLPEYVDEPRGTNVVIVRNPALLPVIEHGIATRRLALEPIAPDRAAESQRSGLRHRREGLACRLHDAASRGDWAPPKRVAATPAGETPVRAAVYRLRERVTRESHLAFDRAKRGNDLRIFADHMAPLVAAYRRLTRDPLPVRLGRFASRLLKAAFRSCSR